MYRGRKIGEKGSLLWLALDIGRLALDIGCRACHLKLSVEHFTMKTTYWTLDFGHQALEIEDSRVDTLRKTGEAVPGGKDGSGSCG